MSQSPVQNGAADWRSSVAQASRNKEVRNIATLLAQLEPGASQSSKLMLAMRFEDGVFSAAKSYQDYRKKLDRRLKRLQKTYQGGSITPPPSDPGEGATAEQNKERITELRKTYGDALRFIMQYAPEAIRETHAKKGEEAAKHLRAHTSNAIHWASQLGLTGTSSSGANSSSAALPTPNLDSKALDKLEDYLKTRVDNIRSHVMKQAKHDLFLQENLTKMELTRTANSIVRVGQETERQLRRTGVLASEMTPISLFKSSFEKAQTVIAPPSRLESSQWETCVAHLERLRACSSAVAAWTALQEVSPEVPRNALIKCYDSVLESLSVLQDLAPKLIMKNDSSSKKLRLEDAWTKWIEIEEEEEPPSLDAPEPPQPSTQEEPAAKRVKRDSNSHHKMAFRSKVLGRNGRKIPVNLLPSIRQKQARLVDPVDQTLPPHFAMEFDDAFTFTVHLCPLLVIIRASEPKDGPTSAGNHRSYSSSNEGMRWTNFGHNLPKDLTIAGVTGSREQLCHVAQHRLQHASAHATHVLRRLFGKVNDSGKHSFEVEIQEGSALLQFLHLVRETYKPS